MSNQFSDQDARPQERVPMGVAVAAVVAAGIGCFALGLSTTLAEISPALKEALNWWNPVGPLSGKTGLACGAWLVSWVILHQMFKNREIHLWKACTIAFVLIAIGLVGTFPTFFERFQH